MRFRSHYYILIASIVFLFGGCVMPIYALSLAHAGDIVETSFLEVGTGILIMNAVGAILGPILATTASAQGAVELDPRSEEEAETEV